MPPSETTKQFVLGKRSVPMDSFCAVFTFVSQALFPSVLRAGDSNCRLVKTRYFGLFENPRQISLGKATKTLKFFVLGSDV
jgi:hypothetical protein